MRAYRYDVGSFRAVIKEVVSDKFLTVFNEEGEVQYVHPKQCRRLVPKRKERVWTEAEIAKAWNEGVATDQPTVAVGLWPNSPRAAGFRKAPGISHD